VTSRNTQISCLLQLPIWRSALVCLPRLHQHIRSHQPHPGAIYSTSNVDKGLMLSTYRWDSPWRPNAPRHVKNIVFNKIYARVWRSWNRCKPPFPIWGKHWGTKINTTFLPVYKNKSGRNVILSYENYTNCLSMLPTSAELVILFVATSKGSYTCD